MLTRRDVFKTTSVMLVVAASAWDTFAASAYYPPSESQGGWRSLVPANSATPNASQLNTIRQRGLDWHKLNNAWNYSHGIQGAADAMVVIKDGWIVFEKGSTKTQTRVASVTKSLAGGLAAAVAFDRNIVHADDRVGNYLSAAWRNADARRAQMRIRHLMSMSSGLMPHDNPGGSGYNTPFILDQPQKHAPGTVWSYASLPIDLLGIILQQETGQKLSAFLKTHVYGRIGVGSFRLTSSLSDTEEAASQGLSITPRDAARLGYLLLHEGWWKDQQILSTENVEFLTLHPSYLNNARFEQTPGSPFVVPPTSPKHYAHTFWTNTDRTALGTATPRDAYYGHGFGEDLVVTLPSLDMVVVRTGSKPTHVAAAGFRQEFMKQVMQAVILP